MDRVIAVEPREFEIPGTIDTTVRESQRPPPFRGRVSGRYVIVFAVSITLSDNGSRHRTLMDNSSGPSARPA